MNLNFEIIIIEKPTASSKTSNVKYILKIFSLKIDSHLCFTTGSMFRQSQIKSYVF